MTLRMSTDKVLSEIEKMRSLGIQPELTDIDLLRVVRAHKRETQTDFANRYGRTLQTLRNWEGGRITIPTRVLIDCMQYFYMYISDSLKLKVNDTKNEE